MRSPEEFDAFARDELAPLIADIEKERRGVAERRQAARLPTSYKLAIAVVGLAIAVYHVGRGFGRVRYPTIVLVLRSQRRGRADVRELLHSLHLW